MSKCIRSRYSFGENNLWEIKETNKPIGWLNSITKSVGEKESFYIDSGNSYSTDLPFASSKYTDHYSVWITDSCEEVRKSDRRNGFRDP